MKRFFAVLLSAALLLSFAACGSDAAPRQTAGSQSPTVQDILDNAGAADSGSDWTDFEAPNTDRNQVDPALAPEEDAPRITGDVIDLTKLSSTLVYSEVYNMLSSPQDYVGKTVTMKGAFNVYEAETRNYYACLIADAAACCAQGIEFELDGDLSYPEDYPEPGADITVTGTFETYVENDLVYCQLSNARLTA